MTTTSTHRLLPRTHTHGNAIKAGVLFGVTTVALVGFATYAIKTQLPPTDRQHCVVNAAPERAHYVLLDLTDPLNDEQLQRVRSAIRAAAAALHAGDRLEISALAASQAQGATTRILFAGCRPRSPEAAGLNEGRRVLEKALQEHWVNPVEASLAKIDSQMRTPSAKSPLMASVKELASRAVGRTRNLTLVSDLLEHSSTVSTYRRGSNVKFDDLHKARLDVALIDGQLKNFQVSVLELTDMRHTKQQAQARVLWHDLFDKAGATVVEFNRI